MFLSFIGIGSRGRGDCKVCRGTLTSGQRRIARVLDERNRTEADVVVSHEAELGVVVTLQRPERLGAITASFVERLHRTLPPDRSISWLAA